MTTATLSKSAPIKPKPDLSTSWFESEFKRVTGYTPFPWHTALFKSFTAGKLPSSCNIPTGLGKTKTILVWWLAWKHSRENGTAPVHTRLVYMVNRRTIVDQASVEAEAIATLFPDEINVSTLRGQKADNQKWKQNPSKPAIIVGTPDMIGSKLLFGGYGDGKYTRPIHAGIIGNDTLFVVDEAHLSVPLCRTLNHVKSLQKSIPECGIHPIDVIELTATPTNVSGPILSLGQDDHDHPVIMERLEAVKMASFERSDSGQTNVVKAICRKAHQFAPDTAKVLVYVNSPETAGKVSENLISKYGPDRVALLTGTLRGYERDRLLEHPVIQAFMDKAQAVDKTIYLVSTSAGEVGWDIDADHLVCDLTPLDSMVQRLGRLNREGTKQSTVHIVYDMGKNEGEEKSRYRLACITTRGLTLRDWDGKSLSPSFLSGWMAGLSAADYQQAVSPSATPVHLHDHVLDAWTLTSIQDPLPCKKPLALYIHGESDPEPETYVAWRSELSLVQASGLSIQKWLEVCRLQPQELLHGRTSAVEFEFAKLAKLNPDLPVAVVDSANQSRFATLATAGDIRNCTVILPTTAGGLRDGLLDGKCLGLVEDVADLGQDRQRITLLVRETEGGSEIDARPFGSPRSGSVQELAKASGMTVARSETFESDPTTSLVVLVKSTTDTAPTATVRGPVTIADHNRAVANEAVKLAIDLGLSKSVMLTLEWAAAHHDLGKAEKVWQQAIYNFDGPALAKSGSRAMNLAMLGNRELGYYRHEFGSLVAVAGHSVPDGVDRELALYLIACHHGYARPHFRPGAGLGIHDPLAFGVPKRFVELQSRYGRWGLAWLHAIFCLADQRAS